MENDNVYPSGSYYPTEPVAQVQEREEEVIKTLAAIPVLKEEVEHLDERIAYYESNRSIPIEILLNPDEFMHLTHAHKLVADILITERNDLLGRIQRAAKE